MSIIIIEKAKMSKNATIFDMFLRDIYTHLCKTHGEDEVDTSKLDNVL